jgi:hypothetical protein
MTRTLVGLVVLTLGAQTPAAPAGQNCKKVEGEFVARLVAPPECPANNFCTAGDLTGDLKGKYAFHLTKEPVPAGAPAAASIQFFLGESTVTLKNGEKLVGIDTGTVDMPPGSGGIASLITWTQGATGQIRVSGVFDRTKQTTSGEYEGSVCRVR